MSRYVTLWAWPLTSWPWMFTVQSHAFKLCTKFERKRIIHGWVIDDLARFCRAILGGRALLPNGSQGCVGQTSPKLAVAVQSFLHKKYVSDFICLAAFSDAGGSKMNDVINNTKFRTFWPPVFVKIRGGLDEISLSIVEALLTTEPSEYIRLRGCWAQCIDVSSEKIRKESSWVKLKAFPTTVGRPNYPVHR